MLKAALWYGHDVIYWAERNKENNEIIPILLEAFQRPERRPFYRTGLAIEHLSPDFRGTVIKHIREELPDNKEVETIVNKAEKNETLKFWEEDLPKIYDSVDLLQYQHCSNYSFWRSDNCELAKQGDNLP